MRSYRPFTDPVFWTSVVVYLINRWFVRDHFPDSFFTRHLNDFLCLPMWCPVLVGILQALRLRPHGGPPAGIEILAPLLVISFVFEVLHPLSPFFREFSTGDPLDVLWYVLGGFAGIGGWRLAHGAYPVNTSGELPT